MAQEGNTPDKDDPLAGFYVDKDGVPLHEELQNIKQAPKPGSHEEEIERCVAEEIIKLSPAEQVKYAESWMKDVIIPNIKKELEVQHQTWAATYHKTPQELNAQLELAGRHIDEEYAPFFEDVSNVRNALGTNQEPPAEAMLAIKNAVRHRLIVEKCEPVSSQPYIQPPIDDGTDKGHGR